MVRLQRVGDAGTGELIFPSDSAVLPGVVVCVGVSTVTPDNLGSSYRVTLDALGSLGACPAHRSPDSSTPASEWARSCCRIRTPPSPHPPRSGSRPDVVASKRCCSPRSRADSTTPHDECQSRK